MSKFIDEIKVRLDERDARRLPRWPQALKVGIEPVQRSSVWGVEPLERYRIFVEYGFGINCSPEDLGKAKENVVSQLRYDIYQDFITLLRQAELALYEHDEDKMRQAIQKLKKEVGI